MDVEDIPMCLSKRGLRLNSLCFGLLVCMASCSADPAADANSALGGGTASNSHAPSSKPRSNSDGPFGIDFGAAADTIPGAKPMDAPGLYQTASPPKAHPDFETVILAAYPDTGICMIRGIGRNNENDGAGLSVRSQIDNLSEALETKYGASVKDDSCAGGDIQCQSQFWMMTLSGGERFYGYSWETPNETMKRNKIRSIYLAARASDINTSYPVLEFHSANEAGCEAAKKKLSASAL